MNGEMTPNTGAGPPLPRPRTAHALLGLVSKSGLVEAARLEEFLRDHELHAGAVEAADRLVAAGLLTAFQAQLLLQGKWRGFHVGYYRVLQPLARGGMGRVYLAKDSRVSGATLEPVRWCPSTGLRPGALVLAVSRPRGTLRVRLGMLGGVGPAYRTAWGARVDAALDVEVSARPATTSMEARSKPISRKTSLAAQRMCSVRVSPRLPIILFPLFRA